MKAIVHERFEPQGHLEVEDLDRPAVGRGEALVRVRAASANTYGWDLPAPLAVLGRTLSQLRGAGKEIPGLDLAGEVVAVGMGAAQFAVGEDVFGWCRGSLAEYVAVPETQLARKPVNLSYAEAATVPIAGFTALQALRKGHICPEQRVLIVGASGGVGTLAVQIAKSFGAEVTGVCSTANADLVTAIGADHVIDYTEQDFTHNVGRYDLIVDMAGIAPLTALRRALRHDGTLVMVGQAAVAAAAGGWSKALGRWLTASVLSAGQSRKLRAHIQQRPQSDLMILTKLIESGQVTPIVSAVYPLLDTDAAVAHFATGHARGRVVVTM